MKSEDVNLIRKTIRWTRQAETAISEAGGTPDFILSLIPEDLLIILIRNDLNLLYLPHAEDD